ncbi:hypothetical protein Apar_0633 [Lancefieldella parvula DSM 20469]|uniref:Uncharacterized protein n=1 Tax=Lancefieldella parvula (strain ATCC 33793 / DSM 20469 / CCUG 32760 / JCM 10300 / KCTC 3663 / VPI 0546 / 1246) TaxID=521095 RepID=C8WAC5_LANP1|nr:hypothetical protein [Lancefieldella parvula]ACV51063.1 hypothetical protein Apar_0633 [Lancefieldella parvula DSM 20469]
MAKKDNNQDTKHKRHGFSGEGPDFDPNDPPQMPDGSPFPVGLLFFIVIMLLSGLGRSCAANNQTNSNSLFGDPYSAYSDSNW